MYEWVWELYQQTEVSAPHVVTQKERYTCEGREEGWGPWWRGWFWSWLLWCWLDWWWWWWEGGGVGGGATCSSRLEVPERPSDMALISVIVSFSGELWRSQVAWMLMRSVPAGLQQVLNSSVGNIASCGGSCFRLQASLEICRGVRCSIQITELNLHNQELLCMYSMMQCLLSCFPLTLLQADKLFPSG